MTAISTSMVGTMPLFQWRKLNNLDNTIPTRVQFDDLALFPPALHPRSCGCAGCCKKNQHKNFQSPNCGAISLSDTSSAATLDSEAVRLKREFRRAFPHFGQSFSEKNITTQSFKFQNSAIYSPHFFFFSYFSDCSAFFFFIYCCNLFLFLFFWFAQVQERK
jgi:hypothetical protein